VGTVQDWNDNELTIDTKSGSVKVPTSRIEAVVFDLPQVDGAPAKTASLLVGLRDGSLLHAAAIEADGHRIVGQAAADVVALQSTGGDSFTYLSDLEPADYRHLSFLDISWPLARDRNLLAGPMISGGAIYLKGLGLHSASRLTYVLDGTASRFEAEFALDDAAGPRGSVVFRVFLARDSTWHEAFASDVVRGDQRPRPVSVDVTGAEVITLVVDYADRGDELDHASWLDARLVR
jgi:hypothetical protein